MKSLTYKLTAKHLGDTDAQAFKETITAKSVTDDTTAEQEGRRIIDYFNSTLKPYEKARVFIAAEEIKTDNPETPHTWEKTSLVTERGGYDKMKCTTCKITGKRYGMGQNGVTIDKEFKKQIYCKP
jgi:hypothetical protein